MSVQMTKPLIKWIGGKTSVLPKILPLFPNRVRTYFEPFFGGGAVFFALDENRYDEAVINDWNDELVHLYRMAQAFPDKLIEQLYICRQEYDKAPKETFLAWRAKEPSELEDIERAARTLFLTKTSFNGLYRLNKQGKFNAPWGKYENPLICDPENIRAASKALQKVLFRRGDFAPAVCDAQAGDLVYFDPPYLALSDTANFSNYTAEGFSVADHIRLRDTFAELVARGVTCILSNHDVPLVHELFAKFEIQQIQVRRSVNSKGDKRGGVGEVLVVGRPEPKLVPELYRWTDKVEETGIYSELLHDD